MMLVSLVGWLLLQSEPLHYGAKRGLFPMWLAQSSQNGNAPQASLLLGATAMSLVLFIQVSHQLLVQFEILESWTVLNTLIPFFLVALALLWRQKYHPLIVLITVIAMFSVLILASAIPISAWLYGVIFLGLSFALKK